MEFDEEMDKAAAKIQSHYRKKKENKPKQKNQHKKNIKETAPIEKPIEQGNCEFILLLKGIRNCKHGIR